MAKGSAKEESGEFRYLVRIGGTDIAGDKKAPVGVSSIKGIGIRTGEIACNLAGVDPNKLLGNLTEEEIEKLDGIVSDFQSQDLPPWLFNRRKDYETGGDLHLTGSDLMMSLREDLNRLRKSRSYRGIRHERGLPVRGQKTKSSFRHETTVGVSRRKMAEKK